MKITYIHHSSFLMELEQAYFLFDYTEGDIPRLDEEKPLFVFASHRHGDHYSPVIFDLKKSHGNIRYVLSNDIWRKRMPEEVLPLVDSMKPGEEALYALTEGEIRMEPGYLKITTYRSTDEGVAFLIEAEEKTIYHGGDLNNWRWEGEPEEWNRAMGEKYRAQIDQMAGMHMDAAFLPLDPRQEQDFYLGMDEFLRRVDVDAIFPMHCWGDFSVIDRIKFMDCSAPYRDRIAVIKRDGDAFVLP